MKLLEKRSWQWLAANLAGIAGYLFFASRFWVSAAEFGNPGGPGDAFAWLFTVAPILLLFAVLQLSAFVVITIRFIRGQRSYAILAWAGVLALWVCAIAIDHHMSYNVIDLSHA